MDKVKFGIKNVHIFPIESMVNGVPTYGDVINVPGAVSFSMGAQGDISKLERGNANPSLRTNFTLIISSTIRVPRTTVMKAILLWHSSPRKSMRRSSDRFRMQTVS